MFRVIVVSVCDGRRGSLLIIPVLRSHYPGAYIFYQLNEGSFIFVRRLTYFKSGFNSEINNCRNIFNAVCALRSMLRSRL